MAITSTAIDKNGQTYTGVRIRLPESVYKEFSSRASNGVDIEDLIVRHLVLTMDQDNEKGRALKISPSERQEIETAFSRSFKDGRELIHHLKQVYSASIGGVTVQLSPDLLKRLDGRRGRMEFDAFIKETVVRQLEHFAGMR